MIDEGERSESNFLSKASTILEILEMGLTYGNQDQLWFVKIGSEIPND